jgi:uncharacterized membrane protein (DUF2068 family)
VSAANGTAGLARQLIRGAFGGPKTSTRRRSMQRPKGVTILAVLAFLLAALTLLAALVFLVGGPLLDELRRGATGMDAMVLAMGAKLGVMLLVLAVVYAVAGIGLWKLQNWGRILTIVVVALGFLSAAAGALASIQHWQPGPLIKQLIVVAIDVWIITYLLKQDVKRAFGAQ